MYVSGRFTGEAQADDAGRWQLTPGREIAAGTHALRADQVVGDDRTEQQTTEAGGRIDREHHQAVEPVGDIEGAGDRIIQRDGELEACAFDLGDILDGHGGRIVVGDGAGGGIGGGDQRVRGAQGDREGLRAFQEGIVEGGDGEGVGLVRRAGEIEGHGIIGIILRCGDGGRSAGGRAADRIAKDRILRGRGCLGNREQSFRPAFGTILGRDNPCIQHLVCRRRGKTQCIQLYT